MHVRGRAPWRQQAALCLPVLLCVCCEASGERTPRLAARQGHAHVTARQRSNALPRRSAGVPDGARAVLLLPPAAHRGRPGAVHPMQWCAAPTLLLAVWLHTGRGRGLGYWQRALLRAQDCQLQCGLPLPCFCAAGPALPVDLGGRGHGFDAPLQPCDLSARAQLAGRLQHLCCRRPRVHVKSATPSLTPS